jgi:predicted transcriptional regulator/ribosome-associated translation inhibitor RaiA
MQVKDFASKKVIFAEHNETISKVLEKMKENKIHQVPVVKNGIFIGMIFLKRLIKKGFFPEKTKVGKLVEKVPALSEEDDLDKAVEMLLKAGVRALPVVKNSKIIGIVSEKDLIKNVKIDREILIQEFEKDVITASVNDTVGRVRSLMENHDISRIPILDENKVVGCVGNLQLLDLVKVPKESLSYSQISKEKLYLDDIPIKEFVGKTFVLSRAEFSLNAVIEGLQKFEEVVVVEDGKPISIFTPKDILKIYFPIEEKFIISGYENLEVFEFYRLRQILSKFASKIDRIFGILEFKVKVKIYSRLGKRKYSLRASLKTLKKTFSVKAHGWKITDTVHELVQRLERMLIKAKELEKDREKGKPRAFSPYEELAF